MNLKHAILTHGGAGSDPKNSDGPRVAAQASMDLLKNGKSALEAVVFAVQHLEDDPRFNAGLGSQTREDGYTIQLDAACMTSKAQFGAVACVEGFQNPILLAQEVLLHSSHILISGDGARILAEKQKIPLKRLPGNFPKTESQIKSALPCDTVGAVAFDGETFAAALSSGGLENAAVGRIGDVPLPGCGLYCGSAGTVACTGDGEFIALKILAKEVYGWLENEMTPSNAALKAISLFAENIDIGLIILTKNDYASGSRNGMAWAKFIDSE